MWAVRFIFFFLNQNCWWNLAKWVYSNIYLQQHVISLHCLPRKSSPSEYTFAVATLGPSFTMQCWMVHQLYWKNFIKEKIISKFCWFGTWNGSLKWHAAAVPANTTGTAWSRMEPPCKLQILQEPYGDPFN